MVPPAAGMTESLRFEQIGFAPPEPVLRFLTRMDVGEQVVPADNPAIAVPKWQAARLKPPVLAIAPPDPVLEFVRLSGLDGVLPGGVDPRQVGGASASKTREISRVPVARDRANRSLCRCLPTTCERRT